jgi:hypothetical protein
MDINYLCLCLISILVFVTGVLAGAIMESIHSDERGMPVKTKSILKSKTMWTNVASIALLVINQLSGANVIPTEYAALGIAVLNIALRILTDSKVTLTK